MDRRLHVVPHRFFRLLLAAIHIGECLRMDEHIRLHATQELLGLLSVSQIADHMRPVRGSRGRMARHPHHVT
jgi:hypothetical protein